MSEREVKITLYGEHTHITTVQKALGHADVRTTMIYLQAVNLLQPQKLKSPLDIELSLQN